MNGLLVFFGFASLVVVVALLLIGCVDLRGFDMGTFFTSQCEPCTLSLLFPDQESCMFQV